jgi:protein-S-isoprenylcysteine O-methyltransferase Ste14
MCSALGYKSDGHFHYDWNYLANAGMIEEKQGFFLVTDTGKKEFALYSTAAMSNLIMVVMGLAMVSFTVGIQLGFLPPWSAAIFGIMLVALGSLFLVLGRRNKPKLPPEAKALLKELRH